MGAPCRTRLSVLVTDGPVSGVGSECAACVSIDIQTSFGTPGSELIRADFHAIDRAKRASLAFDIFGGLLPLIECAGEVLSIDHDIENTGIITASIPRDAGSDNWGICHDEFLSVVSASTTVTDAGGAASVPGGGFAT